MRALALAAAFLLFATPALAQDLTGPARVIDGDTLVEVAAARFGAKNAITTDSIAL